MLDGMWARQGGFKDSFAEVVEAFSCLKRFYVDGLVKVLSYSQIEFPREFLWGCSLRQGKAFLFEQRDVFLHGVA
jgi:hypothetical protein